MGNERTLNGDSPKARILYFILNDKGKYEQLRGVAEAGNAAVRAFFLRGFRIAALLIKRKKSPYCSTYTAPSGYRVM
ncbi:MAG TPA: hypothetical protein VF905_01930, partial [Nitrospirota bacterium]